MHRWLVCSYAMFLSFAWGLVGHSQESEPRPLNVVFILADDLGWCDTTLYGKTTFYKTPNLERLAKRGMLFRRAYSASPLCSPTRSAILTGMSPARTGITVPNGHVAEEVLTASVPKQAAADQKSVQPKSVTRLNTSYTTLAESFRQAGYATGHFGKWHLGPEPYSPLEQGFDVDVPRHPGPGPAGSYVAPWKFKHIQPKSADEHIEDRMASEALAWMESNRDRPFFLNYWMFSVHAPFDAKKDLIASYRSLVQSDAPQRSATYAAMVESMDDAVGTLLDGLDRLGIADRTVVIFTADNGGNMYNEIDGAPPTSNLPLRGGKATLFEGGTRVPCVVVWPGMTAAGSQSDALIQSEDYFATLHAGLGLPAPNQPCDGVSFLDAMQGKAYQREATFQYFPHSPPVPDWLPPAIAIHQDDWKMIRIFFGGEDGEHRFLLFDLGKDLGETTNLADVHPQVVQELDAKIEAFLARTKAIVPVRNPAFDPTKYRPELEGKVKPKEGGAKQQEGKVPKTGGASGATSDAGDNPQMLGWKTRVCQGRVVDGVAIIEPVGPKPFLGFAIGKLQPGAKLRFRIQGLGTGAVAWLASPAAKPEDSPLPTEFRLAGHGDISGQSLADRDANKGSETSDDVKKSDLTWHEVEVDIPDSAGQPGILRVFLPMDEIPVRLDWIELVQGSAKRRWDF